MRNLYDLVVQLTSPAVSESNRVRMLLNDFALEFGWQPSDTLDSVGTGSFANAHLVVEHGLENTAVISFLRSPRRFADLDHAEKRALLNISYNNLVDWHIQIEPDEIVYVFNRTDPARVVGSHRISRDSVEDLRSEAFEQITGRRPSPNIPALDNALIETISIWMRSLNAEMNYSVSNLELSALFNAIIFTRAAEDHFGRLYPTIDTQQRPKALLDACNPRESFNVTLREVILRTLETFFGAEGIPEYLVNQPLLRAFDSLDSQTVFALVSDFYTNKYAPYEYNFSLMSKHALSRIYEHYVSILRLEEDRSAQASLFPRLPEAELNKSYGSIYTPQFIARFFARYLRQRMPPLSFKRLRPIDPACGSGIFLRSILEIQCDPTQDRLTTEVVSAAFENIVGIDADENACQAARLSLALLHMVLTDRLPQTLAVSPAEAIQYYQEHPELKGTFDAVIANPPFVALTTQSPAMRERVSTFMQQHATGRIDVYLAFLRIGLELLKPGGTGMFVLPHSFLLGKNAALMRERISKTSWIRCLADLSAIRVFEDTGSYIILLIFQKRLEPEEPPPPATIIRCQDLVGRALEDAVEGRRTETNFFSIYDVSQDVFETNEWVLLPPAESAIKRKLEALPTLDRFFEIHQGFISGRDDVFILAEKDIPKREKAIFVPFLPDRGIRVYTVPEKTDQYFFYPFVKGRKLDEKELKRDFPNTWEYLSAHRSKLKARPPVRSGQLAWWQPERPRMPSSMMRPKIVSPHLVLTPRFALDRMGRYAVSRSPLMYPRDTHIEDDLLRLFVAFLNSTPCYWYIAEHSHTYRGGYVMLEPKTLARTRVPDPAHMTPAEMRRLLKLVDRRLVASSSAAVNLEREIDKLVADLYGLTAEERLALGIEE